MLTYRQIFYTSYTRWWCQSPFYCNYYCLKWCQKIEYLINWSGYFSDSVDVHIYKRKIFFFHHISSFLTTVWLLLQNFHPETSFVIRPFIKAGLVKVCLLFCPIYYTWIANIVCISKVKSNVSVCWSHC